MPPKNKRGKETANGFPCENGCGEYITNQRRHNKTCPVLMRNKRNRVYLLEKERCHLRIREGRKQQTDFHVTMGVGSTQKIKEGTTKPVP